MTRKGTYDCTDLYIEKKIRYEEGGFFDGNFYTLHIGGDTISCLIMEQLKYMHKLLGQVIEAETKHRKAWKNLGIISCTGLFRIRRRKMNAASSARVPLGKFIEAENKRSQSIG